MIKQHWFKIHSWYERYERPFSIVALVAGFILDTLTLRRADLLIEDVWIMFLLFLSAAGITALNYATVRGKAEEGSKIRFWLVILIQFAFGGLFSSMVVFYWRSATLGSSWPFLLLLVFLFIGNEFFKKHYTRLVFQLSVFFTALFSFCIFFVPVIVRHIGTWVFILSSLVSLIIFALFLIVFARVSKENLRNSFWKIVASIGGILVIIYMLYFFHFIPPIPLLLKEVAVLHSLEKKGDGYYIEYEQRSGVVRVKDFLRSYTVYHRSPGERVYIYSAIFSPTKFDLKVVHEWQKFDEEKDEWRTTDRVTLPIVGGRDGGYRAYSYKTSALPGMWRVNIRTQGGQFIGRQTFKVESAMDAPVLEASVR